QGSVIAGIGLSADGRTAVTLSGEPGAYTAHVWTITSSRGVAGQAIPPPSRVNGVAVDGRSLAVADADSASVALWHLTGPGHLQHMSPLSTSDIAAQLVYNAPGTQLAEASGATIQVWGVARPAGPSLAATMTLSGMQFGINSLDYSPSTSLLLVRGESTALLDTDFPRVAGSLCTVTGSTITAAQWQHYAPNIAYHPPCR